MNVADKAWLEEPAFWPRVSTYESRIVEQTLAGANLLETPLELRGGIVEATFAMSDPPLLARLREGGWASQ